MAHKGKIHKFGDDVNTDEIIPARYLNTTDKAELAKHCMEDADAGFAKKVKPGDIIAAGKNFGCGSSREHAPVAIKASGVSCVIADSFARIFARNAINTGLPLVESAEAARAMRTGDIVVVDTVKGTVKNLTKKKTYRVQKYPPFMRKIISAGGLMNYIKKRLSK